MENPFHVSTWASAQAETDDVQTAKHLAHCAGNKVRGLCGRLGVDEVDETA